MSEEQLTNTNIQTAFPVSSQDTPQCTEGVLELKSPQIKTSELAVKSLRHDDSIIIKLGIESGESVTISDDVRKLLFCLNNLSVKYYILLYVTISLILAP